MHTRTPFSSRQWRPAWWWLTAAAAGALLVASGCGKKPSTEGGGSGSAGSGSAGSGSAGSAPPPTDRSAAVKKWLPEFKPSTLSEEQQTTELKWFQDAAKPFAGMKIKVVSETIDTHVYESKTLAKAFTELTGIEVTHDIIQEGDVIEKLQTQ